MVKAPPEKLCGPLVCRFGLKAPLISREGLGCFFQAAAACHEPCCLGSACDSFDEGPESVRNSANKKGFEICISPEYKAFHPVFHLVLGAEDYDRDGLSVSPSSGSAQWSPPVGEAWCTAAWSSKSCFPEALYHKGRDDFVVFNQQGSRDVTFPSFLPRAFTRTLSIRCPSISTTSNRHCSH